MTSETHRAEGDELRQYVDRIERMEAERKDLAEHQKEAYAEAKASGYDTAILRKVLARRKRDRDDLAEEAALLELYEDALNGGGS